MKSLFSLFVVLALALGSLDAEAARRLGGGKSIGQQSSQVTQRSANPNPPAAPGAPAQSAAPAQAPKAPAAAAPAPKRPWGAMLGGLAAGLGLAWLAHSLGLGGAFGSVLLLVLLGFVVVAVVAALMRRRAAPQPALAGAAGAPGALRSYSPDKVGNDASARPWERDLTPAGGSMIGSALGTPSQAGALDGPQGWGIPAGFDVAGFLDAAKRNFVTLQAAWDRADMATLRSMMTDAMVAEIQAQLAERERHDSGVPNHTEVVMLDARLLGIEDLGDAYLASVEFNGVIREEPGAAPTPFREVWNLSKPKQGLSGWLVAGVQALQ